MTIQNEKVILSIETAVGGGSLSLLANETEIDGWSGTLKISKAEDVLEQIAKLLKENNIGRNQIELISISKDVGSLTGRKIGLALAKGLTKSLNCRLVEISVLEALLVEVETNFEGNFITAVAGSGNNIWWQLFEMKDSVFPKRNSSPQISTADNFYESVRQIDFVKIIFSSDILEKDARALQAATNLKRDEYMVSGLSLAATIGLTAARKCVR